MVHCREMIINVVLKLCNSRNALTFNTLFMLLSVSPKTKNFVPSCSDSPGDHTLLWVRFVILHDHVFFRFPFRSMCSLTLSPSRWRFVCGEHLVSLDSYPPQHDLQAEHIVRERWSCGEHSWKFLPPPLITTSKARKDSRCKFFGGPERPWLIHILMYALRLYKLSGHEICMRIGSQWEMEIRFLWKTN